MSFSFAPRKVFFAVIVLGVMLFAFSVWIHQKQRVVVLLYSHTQANHNAVRDRFVLAVKNHVGAPLKLREFSVQSTVDKIGIENALTAAFALKPGCIVSIGRNISQSLINGARKRGHSFPIVFINVEQPVEFGMVASLEHPGGCATGAITAGLDGNVPARLLLNVYPRVRSVLLPYCFANDANRAVEKRAREIESHCKVRGCAVQVVPIGAVSEALMIIENTLAAGRHDLILTLEGDEVNSALYTGIAKLTRKMGVGFFSGFRWALEEGALFCYGVAPQYAADKAFQQVSDILDRGMYPSSMPVEKLGSSREFIVNAERARELGITLDLEGLKKAIEIDPALVCVRERVRVVS